METAVETEPEFAKVSEHGVMPIDGSTAHCGQRILIVRLSAMGDVIHSMPAAALLRNAFPTAHIGWIIEERWAELLCARAQCRLGPRSAGKPLVDAVHTVNMKAWRWAPFSDETWREGLASLRELRATKYDIAVDLQGAIRSAVLAQIVGTPVRFGFDRPREYAASLFYTRRVVARGRHIIEQHAVLAAEVAGVNPYVPEIEFPRDEETEQWCDFQLRERELRDFAILNPGAGWGAKQWPPERYAEVARGLAEMGVASLVNFGPGEESLAKAVEQASDGAAEAVSCSITELIALTRRATLFIGGDTGPMHLAAALHIPVVGIFGPTDPVRNGPYGTRSIVLRSPSSVTTHARRSRPDEGLLAITAGDVIEAARQLLRGGLE
jgi:heptosyltransferase-1